MELRAFKALAEAGATWAEIARETGYDWRTVKRYLSADAGLSPPAPAKRGTGPAQDRPVRAPDRCLAAGPAQAEGQRDLGAAGQRARLRRHYQRVKVYVRENPRAAGRRRS
jgi:transposase